MKPRNTLIETRAHGQLRRQFFVKYVRAYLIGGNDITVGDATDIFEESILDIMKSRLSEIALTTQVIITDRLSNGVLGSLIVMGNKDMDIAVNARFKVDPELLAHTIIEEYAHAHQVLAGVDIEAERHSFPNYKDRPYEIEAKQIATDILGYSAEGHIAFLVREEPEGILYDQVV